MEFMFVRTRITEDALGGELFCPWTSTYLDAILEEEEPGAARREASIPWFQLNVQETSLVQSIDFDCVTLPECGVLVYVAELHFKLSV